MINNDDYLSWVAGSCLTSADDRQWRESLSAALNREGVSGFVLGYHEGARTVYWGHIVRCYYPESDHKDIVAFAREFKRQVNLGDYREYQCLSQKCRAKSWHRKGDGCNFCGCKDEEVMG